MDAKRYTHIMLKENNNISYVAFSRPLNINQCEGFRNHTLCEMTRAREAYHPFSSVEFLANKMASVFFSTTEINRGFAADMVFKKPAGDGYIIILDLLSCKIIKACDEKDLISAVNCDTIPFAAKVDYSGQLKASVTVELTATASTNDIYNWIQNCDNPETLRYLGKAALNAAKRLENPSDPREDDIMR